MPLADWDFFVGGGSPPFGIQGASPILGTGSLEVQLSSNDNFQAQRNSGFNRGFEKGRIRTIVRIDAFTGTGFHVGFFCMTPQENVASGGGSPDIYTFNFAPFHQELRIQKQLNGIDYSGSSGLASVAQAYTLGNTLPLECEWNLDIPGINGIVLTMRTGNEGDLDYTNLTDRVSVTDFSFLNPAPPFAEGLQCTAGSSESLDVKFDFTEIFSGT